MEEVKKIFSLNVNGAINNDDDRSEYWPRHLIYYRDILQIIYQVQQWQKLSDEARVMIDYILNEEVKSYPGYPLDKALYKIFRPQWGQVRLNDVILEVKRFYKKVFKF